MSVERLAAAVGVVHGDRAAGGAILAGSEDPRSVPDPDSATVWPPVTTLSGLPAATEGQVNVVPPIVSCPPGVSAVGVPAASAWAE